MLKWKQSQWSRIRKWKRGRQIPLGFFFPLSMYVMPICMPKPIRMTYFERQIRRIMIRQAMSQNELEELIAFSVGAKYQHWICAVKNFFFSELKQWNVQNGWSHD